LDVYVIAAAVAQDVNLLVFGRFLVGLVIGVASMLTPLYLAEISPARDCDAIVPLNFASPEAVGASGKPAMAFEPET